MKKILECEHLTKSFGKNGKKRLVAIDDVSFFLNEGEILAIVGESGSGKSTIAKLITGLQKCDEGKVIIDGEDISALKGKKRREMYEKIQMVFQNPMDSFDPKKTLGYGIGENLRNQKASRMEMNIRIGFQLTKCGLPENFMDKYAYEVSGGQCQRAAIARSLIVKPKILVCDEATSALDVTIQKQIIDLLKQLKTERNLSIIFICHNLALLQQFCDRVLVLHKGKVIEQGTPDQIINTPQTEYTKNLIDSIFTIEQEEE